MRIVAWNELKNLEVYRTVKTALTIGVFDGLHLGHRKLIEHTVHNAAALLPVVVTFQENPQRLLTGPEIKKDIITIPKKLEILASLGVKVAVMIDFSLNFSKMSATFFFNTLAQAFHIKKIVVGKDFCFGRNREAGSVTLKKMGAGIGAFLEVLDTVHYKGIRVSSTRIRHSISEGNFADARIMLLNDYCISLTEDDLLWREGDRFLIATKALRQIVPPPGIYRCRIETKNGCEMEDIEIDRENISLRAKTAPIKALCFLEKQPVHKN